MRIAVAGASGVVGRHVVRSSRARGHDTVPLSRTDGTDLTTGDGLAARMAGVDVVVDVTNAGTTEERAATDFFTTVTRNLHRAGDEAGVTHLVTLSIVGIDAVPLGYYAAKLVHEREAAAGTVPATALRATQLHEFAPQLLLATQADGHATVLDMTVQTVAASAVAERLLDVASSKPQGRAADVAGPDTANLVVLARQFVARFALPVDVRADADTVAGMPDGALIAGPSADLIGPTWADWLDSDDAAAFAERAR